MPLDYLGMMQGGLDRLTPVGQELAKKQEMDRPLTEIEKWEARVRMGEVDPKMAALAMHAGVPSDTPADQLHGPAQAPAQGGGMMSAQGTSGFASTGNDMNEAAYGQLPPAFAQRAQMSPQQGGGLVAPGAPQPGGSGLAKPIGPPQPQKFADLQTVRQLHNDTMKPRITGMQQQGANFRNVNTNEVRQNEGVANRDSRENIAGANIASREGVAGANRNSRDYNASEQIRLGFARLTQQNAQHERRLDVLQQRVGQDQRIAIAKASLSRINAAESAKSRLLSSPMAVMGDPQFEDTVGKLDKAIEQEQATLDATMNELENAYLGQGAAPPRPVSQTRTQTQTTSQTQGGNVGAATVEVTLPDGSKAKVPQSKIDSGEFDKWVSENYK